MKFMPPVLHKYLYLIFLSASQSLKNYKFLTGLSLFLIACLIIFSNLWKLASSSQFTPDQLLWYIAFNEWVLIAIPGIQFDIEQELRDGRLAYLLPRPISYIGSKFAEGFGRLLVNLAFLGCIAFTFTWFWVGMLPFSLNAFLVAILLGVLAGTTALIFQLLVGLTAFWLNEVGPFSWMWEKLLFVFGGLILPLAAYPEWMQKVAWLTPFSTILGERSALAIYPQMSHFIFVTFSLIFWCCVGITLVTILYRKGLRILNMEGG